MKILFLSFYYEPDLSAGSFRSKSLVKALLKELPNHSKIEVITTVPNRYNSFVSNENDFEVLTGLNIHRVKIPKHKNGFLDQSKAFLIFAKTVLRLSNNNNYDLIFSTSSRLMTGTLGALISKKNKVPLYLDIRDIFVDTIKELLPDLLAWVIVPILSALESWTISNAKQVNVVSKGFLPYFYKRYPYQKFVFFMNGIDKDFINAKPRKYKQVNRKVLEVVYAGNIGEGQGLHKIVPELGKKFKGLLKFKLIGDGSQKEKLVSAIKKLDCDNIEILPPLKRNFLIKVYKEADILFLHLNNYKAFKKVLPSKLFEYAALGKPIWAGIDGYAADFVNKNINNAAIFSPCNLEEAVKSFNKLEICTQPRPDFIKKFDRQKIMENMAKDIINLRVIK